MFKKLRQFFIEISIEKAVLYASRNHRFRAQYKIFFLSVLLKEVQDGYQIKHLKFHPILLYDKHAQRTLNIQGRDRFNLLIRKLRQYADDWEKGDFLYNPKNTPMSWLNSWPR